MSDAKAARSILDGKRFAAYVLAVVAATSAPYILWWLRTPPDQIALPGSYASLGDFLTYASWVKQAVQGHVLFLNLYDPSPQKRTLFLPFFLAVGLFAKSVSLSPMWALHVARAAASAMLLLTARWFCRALVVDGGTRIRAFLMLTLGTGLPSLIPEASPISSMFDSSLHAFAWTPILLGAGCWILAIRRDEARLATVTGGCVSVMLVTHPYDAVSLTALVLTTSLLDVTRTPFVRVLRRGAMFGLCALPGALWTLFSMTANPALATWALFPRRTAGWELLSFGTIAILALFARWSPASADGPPPQKRDPLLVAWVATSLLLLFLPIPSQRRYIQGIQAPLAILAAQGFDGLVARGFPRVGKWLLATAFPVSVLMLLFEATGLVPSTRSLDARLASEIAALETLPPGVIFSNPYLGQLIAPFAGRQIFAGHPSQTPDIRGKAAIASRFESGEIGGADLAGLGVRYAVVDARLPPRAWTGIRQVREGARTRVYEVLPP